MNPLSQPVASMPFAVWTDVALRTGEMLVASAQVIGHRTQRIVAAGHSPGQRDRREFVRMGLEKVEAAGESLWSMGQQLIATNTQLWTRAWQDGLAAATAWMAFGSSRTLPQFMERQFEVAHALARSARSVEGLSDAAAHLVGQGLKPIHARATANARRLAS
jgi:hypothetical protein